MTDMYHYAHLYCDRQYYIYGNGSTVMITLIFLIQSIIYFYRELDTTSGSGGLCQALNRDL